MSDAGGTFIQRVVFEGDAAPLVAAIQQVTETTVAAAARLKESVAQPGGADSSGVSAFGEQLRSAQAQIERTIAEARQAIRELGLAPTASPQAQEVAAAAQTARAQLGAVAGDYAGTSVFPGSTFQAAGAATLAARRAPIEERIIVAANQQAVAEEDVSAATVADAKAQIDLEQRRLRAIQIGVEREERNRLAREGSAGYVLDPNNQESLSNSYALQAQADQVKLAETLRARIAVAEEALGLEVRDTTEIEDTITLRARMNVLQQEMQVQARAQQDEQAALLGVGGGSGDGNNGQGNAGFFGRIFGSQASGLGRGLVGGAAGFAVFAGLQDSVRYALDLDKALALVQSRLQIIGQSDKFPQIRDDILSMARESGVAATEIADVAVRLTAAFGSIQQGTAATQSAIELSVVSGQSLKDSADQLTAIGTSYGVAGTNVSKISDGLLASASRYGITVAELGRGVSTLAQTGQFAGFTFNQLGAIIGKVAQVSQTDGNQAAERLTRIVPLIDAKAQQLLQLSQTDSALGNVLTPADFSGADSASRVLNILGQNFKTFSSETQAALLSVLGSGRGAQSLLPVLQSWSETLQNANEDEKKAGVTHAAYAAQQETLAQGIKRVREEFNQLGDALAQAGLFQILTGLLNAIEGVIGGVAQLNRALGGIPAALLEILLGLKLIEALSVKIGGTQAAGGLTQLVRNIAGRATGPAAEEGAATEETANAAGTGLIAALGPIPIAVGVVGLAIKTETDRLQVAADNYRASLHGVGEQALAEAAKQSPSIAQRLGSVFGPPTPAQVAQGEQRARQAANSGIQSTLQAAIQGNVVEPFANLVPQLSQLDLTGTHGTEITNYVNLLKSGTKGLPDLLKAVDDGNRSAIEVATIYVNALSNDPAKSQQLKEALAKVQGADAKAAASAAEAAATLQQALPESLQPFDVVEQDYQAGSATAQEYVNALQRSLKSLNDSISAGVDLNNNLKTAAEERKKLADFLDTRRTQTDDLANTLEQSTGNPNADADQVVRKLAELTGPNALQDPDNRFKAAQDVYTLENKILNDAVSSAKSASAAAAILQQGVTIPDAARAAVLAQQITTADPEFIQTIKDSVAAVDPANASSVTASLVELFAEYRVAGVDAVDALNRAYTDLNKANKVLWDQYNAAVANLPNLDLGGGSIGLAYLPTAPPQPLVVPNTTDTTPVPSATITGSAKDQADQQKQAASEQIRIDKETRDAIAALNEARVANDPLAVARAELDKALQEKRDADEQFAVAAGDAQLEASAVAAQNQAEADRIKADHSVQDAIGNIADSRIQLLEALAKAAGDDVGAAQLHVQEISDQLARAQTDQNGVDESKVNQLKASLAQAQADVTQTTISVTEETIQRNLDLQRISVGQAVAQLRALEAAQTSEKAKDDIELKIRQLLNQQNNDVFNLPQNVKLPTLYEVGRFQTAQQLGIGYQDNRNINIQLTITNGMTQLQATQMLAQAIGNSATVNGATSRLY